MSGNIYNSHGQLRAQSFSIQVSTRTRCNGGCLYCISRTTPGNEDLPCGQDPTFCGFARLKTGLNYARHLGATHAILTGKADPLQEDPEYLLQMIELSSDYLPLVDMHTNGLLIHPGMQNAKLLERMFEAGLSMITFSIASFDEEKNFQLMRIKKSAASLIAKAAEIGLLVRCSLVVNKLGVANAAGVLEYIKQAGELGAHQVVIREVWVPEVYGQYNQSVYEWNLANRVDIKTIQEQFFNIAQTRDNGYGLRLRDPLPWGTPVFTMGGVFKNPSHGVNLTFACCDEGTSGEVIKSIVHDPSGHGFRNWDDRGDILY